MALSAVLIQFLASVKVLHVLRRGLNLPYDHLSKIKFLDDPRIKGNRIVNPLFHCEFSQANCGNDKQKLRFLRNFSAMKIKVDRKRTCLEPKKVNSKIVLIDSDHLRKKCGKRGLL